MFINNNIYHLEFSEAQKQFHFSETNETPSGWDRIVTMPLEDCISFVTLVEKLKNVNTHIVLFELNSFLEKRNYKKRLAKLN